LVTPKAGAKYGLLFHKQASAFSKLFLLSTKNLRFPQTPLYCKSRNPFFYRRDSNYKVTNVQHARQAKEIGVMQIVVYEI
jgi:hypothetical protein